MPENDERKTSIYGYLKNPSMVDFPAYLSAVFFTAGCNFTCGFCHNAALMGRRRDGMTLAALSDICVRFKESWVSGAVVTGGEPTLCDDLPELLAFFRSHGFAVKLDTNGSNPEMLKDCLPLVDYVAMDVKAGPSGYQALAGFSDMARIQRSISLIMQLAKDYEFRTTIIESFHDSEQMEGIARLIQGAKRYIIQPFIPADSRPGEFFRSRPRTRPEVLRRIQDMMSPFVSNVLIRGD